MSTCAAVGPGLTGQQMWTSAAHDLYSIYSKRFGKRFFPLAISNAAGRIEPLDISDLFYLIDYMFTGGPPPSPYP